MIARRRLTDPLAQMKFFRGPPSYTPGQTCKANRVLARIPAPSLVVASILSVQLGSAVAATLFDRVGPPTVVLMRIGMAALVLLVVARPSRQTLSRDSLKAAAILGVTLAGMNLCFYEAIARVPLGIAVTIEFIGPLMVAIVQTRRLIDGVCAVIAGFGVVLLSWPSQHSMVPLSGLLLALIAGLFWAAYILASARLGEVTQGMSGLAVAMTIAAILVLPVGLSSAQAVVDTPWLLVVCFGVAMLSSFVPYTLELSALRRIPTRVFGVLMSLEPAIASVTGLAILGQRFTVRTLVATALVTSASAIVTYTSTREPVTNLDTALPLE